MMALPVITMNKSLDSLKNDGTKQIYPITAEVVQLNLNAGTMRIRYKWWNFVDQKDTIRTEDIPSDEFFKNYRIVSNDERIF